MSVQPFKDAGWNVVTGPSALSGDFKRFWLLTQRIALMEFKLRFFGSVLGYVWQLMRPLMLFGVLLIVFTTAFPVGDVPHYAVMLLLGIVLFTFMGEAIGGSVASVVDKENLVRKIHFPRLVIPLSVVLTAVFTLTLNLLIVLLFGAIRGVEPHWGLLQVPIGVGVLVTLALGFAMLVSALYVRFRDMRPITDVFLQVSFYASPILYPLEKLPGETAQKLMILLNPFACVLQQLRHAAIDPTEPSSATIAGGFVWLLIPAGIVVAVFLIGFTVFNRAAPRIAEDL